MDIIIKQAYAYSEAQDFFKTITKATILELYTELDYIFDLLESLDIVSRYNRNEILKDFRVEKHYDDIYVCVGEQSKKVDVQCIVNEIVKVFEKRN